MTRGKYVVIEGNDGTGKSTQVELLAKYLNEQGIDTFVMHEPAGTSISAAIREVILNGDLERDGLTNLLLFTAARHENWKVAKKELEAGKWVISARNYISTEVFQGYGEDVQISKIHEITRQFTDATYMKPDYTFVLTLDNTTRAERIAQRGEIKNKDTFESRDENFQRKLNQGYEELARKYSFPVIDATRSIDNIQAELRQLITLNSSR